MTYLLFKNAHLFSQSNKERQMADNETIVPLIKTLMECLLGLATEICRSR
jgi:hypothetical protein